MTLKWPLTHIMLMSHVWLYPWVIVSNSHGWPLTPSLLRSHVWLYPRIIVSKSHENTSKYVNTVTLLSKPWTKGHWPLDELWPHVCWVHMCYSTQRSLCPSPMGIHQCMWIQWSILQNTTCYLHAHTYILRTEWVITYSLFIHNARYRTVFFTHYFSGCWWSGSPTNTMFMLDVK